MYKKAVHIAKMTAQCALYMDALKIFVSPWLRPPDHGYFSGNCKGAFVAIDRIEVIKVCTKFEVRSFICS